MNSFRLAILVVIAPFGISVLHAMLSRFVRLFRSAPSAPQVVAFTAIMLGNVPATWLAWKFCRGPSPSSQLDLACGIAYVLLTYNGFGFCYFHFFNATETSLHIHIIMEIFKKGPLPSAQLATTYNAKEMISARIERMIALGQLEDRGGRYVLSNRSLLLIGTIFDGWRRVLGLPLNPPSE